MAGMDFTNHPVLEVFWSFFIIFLWVAWFWILISVVVDVFRRHDISGWGKALWLIVVILVPFLGVLIYVVTQGANMSERQREEAQRRYQALAGAQGASAASSASEIQQAKDLLDRGVINQAEFEQLKQKALA
jgi:predicted PurR-regulated permease PerM